MSTVRAAVDHFQKLKGHEPLSPMPQASANAMNTAAAADLQDVLG